MIQIFKNPIGIYKPELEEKVVRKVKIIGKVEVGHGETSFKTPDVIEYIQRAKLRLQKK